MLARWRMSVLLWRGTMDSSLPKHSHLRALAAVGIALAAAWAGGATQRAAQAGVFAAMGVALLLPARRAPSRGFLVLAVALLALAGVGFLPQAWFAASAWRGALASLGVALPGTLSPQPARTLDALALLAVGLVWAAWLSAQAWGESARRVGMHALAVGVTVLAGVLLLAWVQHWQVPGWLSPRGVGPFPNRNHTGHVLALGGIVALGCAADAARRKWARALPWLGCTAVLLVALAVNYSRGGVLLFLGALGIWTLLVAWQRRSWKVVALGSSALLALAALLLVASGPLAARFAGGAESQIAFRTAVWRDTLALIHAAPWCGVGLGNFTAVFPFYRHASVIQQAVLHPESDWLQLAAELGWGGVALMLAALCLLVRAAFPLDRGSSRSLRGAALAGALAAALHATIDVPEHRLGCALLALLVLAFARRDEPLQTPNFRVQSPESKASLAWRSIGAGLLALAACWAGVADDSAHADALYREGRYDEAAAAATRALAREPLDYGAYFSRAEALACSGHTLEALADFTRARALEPHYAGLPLEEGKLWASRQPGLALLAWREALQRVLPPEDDAIFGAILDAAPDNLAFRARLLVLVSPRPALQLAWFQYAPPEEAAAHLAELRAAAEKCDPARRAAFQKRAEELGKR